ncbi:MAG: hypothetical protein IT355_14685 [Gemmatimonadaceae bacterium]|nr:hypothetical protein [Gemmatimonadaceae bacterium]
MRNVDRLVALAVALLLRATPAHAHLMPAQQGTLNVRDNAVFAALSVPVSALHRWDADGDGRMSPSELDARRAEILVELDAGITIRSDGTAGRRDLLLPSVAIDEGDPLAARGGTHLLVLVRQSFDTAPGTVQLRLSLFGRIAAEREFLVKALHRGTGPEVAIITPADAMHDYFAPDFFASAKGMLSRLVAWCHGLLASS